MFGLPATIGEYSIELEQVGDGYLPDEITLIRRKAGQEIGRKTFANVGKCVNASDQVLGYLHPEGVFTLFSIEVPEGGELWKPMAEIDLLGDEPAFRSHHQVRVFVDRGQFILQTPDWLYCFEGSGKEVWRSKIDDFSEGDSYTEPSAIHFLEDHFYLVDGSRVARFDREKGERKWTTAIDGYWYGPGNSSLILSADERVVAFSVTYFFDWWMADVLRKSFFSREPFGGDEDLEATVKLSEREKVEFLAAIAEVRAFGSRALQVHLLEIIDDPKRVDPTVAGEARELLETEWPEFRSEERRLSYLVEGLGDPPEHAFDRIAAWRGIFSHRFHQVESLLKVDFESGEEPKYGIAPFYFWPGPQSDALGKIPEISAPMARKIFETDDGVERLFAALILVSQMGKPDGFTEAEAEVWWSSEDPWERMIGSIAWSWYAEREQVFQALQAEQVKWQHDMLKTALIGKTDAEPSDAEIRYWRKQAEELTDASRGSTFVEGFRSAWGGEFPAVFESTVRSVFTEALEDPRFFTPGKFVGLCEFDNPEDNALIAGIEERLSENQHAEREAIRKRRRRMQLEK